LPRTPAVPIRPIRRLVLRAPTLYPTGRRIPHWAGIHPDPHSANKCTATALMVKLGLIPDIDIDTDTHKHTLTHIYIYRVKPTRYPTGRRSSHWAGTHPDPYPANKYTATGFGLEFTCFDLPGGQNEQNRSHSANFG